jgi:hypothetical protein
MKKDDECSCCLEIKPILYLSSYQIPGVELKIYECSECRMTVNHLDLNEFVTPSYIWDHLPRVREELK